MRSYLPVSKIVKVYPRSEQPSESEQTKPVLTLYPKVQMPVQPHGYLKAKESDFF